MFTSRRCTILAAGALLGLLGLGVFLKTATAGKSAPPPPPPPKAPDYSFEFLGTLGGRDSSAYSINSRGDVVGNSQTATGAARPFLSTVGIDGVRRMYDLNTLISAADQAQWLLQEAFDINDAGQIVGHGYFNGVQHGFRYTPAYDDVSGDHLAVIEPLGVFPARINSIGNAAAYENESPLWAEFDPDLGWITHAVSDLGLGGTQMFRINDNNEICGVTWAPPNGDVHAFRFDPVEGMVDLGFLKANQRSFTESRGYDIDNQGQVVGSSTAGGSNSHAFRCPRMGGMVDLGTLGGGGSWASGITRSGTLIVGKSSTAVGSEHLFLYDTSKKVMMDLEAAIWNLPAQYTGLLGVGYGPRINNSGQICGSTMSGPSNTLPSAAFLLTPKPKP